MDKKYKINHTYLLKSIGDSHVVVPAGENENNTTQMLLLSESAYLLWNILEQGADRQTLLRAILQEYDVSEEEARNDIDSFLSSLMQLGALE